MLKIKEMNLVISPNFCLDVSVTTKAVFDFLRDEWLRSEWDIFPNGGSMQEMVHIANGTCFLKLS